MSRREAKNGPPRAAGTKTAAAPRSRTPNDASATLRAAVEHHQAGRLDEAETLYRRILRSHPAHPDALHLLGVIAHQRGEHATAEELIRKAIRSSPRVADYHNNLGSALYGQDKWDEAEESFRRALEIDPRLAMAHNNLGNVLHERGELAQAEESYRRAVEIEPENFRAHNNLGTLLKVLGRYDEAKESLNRALELKLDDTEAHHYRALVHKFVPGDPEVEKLKELLERKGTSEDQRNPLLFALGKAHDDIGLYAEAFSYYRQANEEKAKQVNFDMSHRQQQVMEIKKVFRDRHRSESRSSGKVERVPIFITGLSRSGKTLTKALLTQDRKVFSSGSASEWFQAIENVLDKYSISASFPNCMDFLREEQIREIGKTYMEDISKYSPESHFFINTKTEHYLYIGLMLHAFPFARIIYCHRDPLDNCLFIYFKRYPSGSPLGSDPVRRLCDLRCIASYYVDYHDLMEHWQRLYGDRILGVRYEDLVRNPVETGARLYEYCGLEYDLAAIRCAFRTDEIGHWKHYEPYLGPLREALGGLAH